MIKVLKYQNAWLEQIVSYEIAEAQMVDIGQIQQEMVLKSCNWLLFINL
jgi:hypothetical protein